MFNDLVINSYEEQLKESILKAQAVKIAGFDLIIAELKKRSINCDDILTFFETIKNANTKEEINNFTIDDLNVLIDNINLQITKALISAVEVAGSLSRNSRSIAIEKSPNGKVNENDNYIKVGSNLANEITSHGISHGLNICIRNYCIQKMYQATYKEKIKERKIRLGIYEEEKDPLKNNIKKELKANINKTLKEIFNKDTISESDKSFEELKANYFDYINNKINHLNEYK